MEYALAILAAIIAVIGGWYLLGGRIPRRAKVPDGWHIGPIVNGRNESRCKFETTPTGWKVILKPGDELHAVLMPVTSLPDPMKFTYRVTGTFEAVEAPEPHLSLYFQREGDDWSNSGAMQWFRWYSRTLFPLTPGEHTIRVPLKPEHWKGVNIPPKPHEDHWFHEAVADPVMMGFGFGGRGGRMHGITGTGTIEMTTGD